MAKPLRKILSKVAPFVVMAVVLVAFSAFHARRSCDSILTGELAPPPHHSTRFVLYPARHIAGPDEIGMAPGWVVTYVSHNKTYGTAFFVSLFGKMIARGDPAIVVKHREQAQGKLDQFKAAFAQADAAVPVGSTFSNAVSILGQPITTFTNANGSSEAYFNYMPAAIGQIRIEWLTNGFTLLVSNNIVIRKEYSYTSSH